MKKFYSIPEIKVTPVSEDILLASDTDISVEDLFEEEQ